METMYENLYGNCVGRVELLSSVRVIVPSFCGVVGCANNAMRNHDKSYHTIPSERDERGRIQKQRSERRQAWIQELHRKGLDRCQVKVS
jgi:hypothetical protein